MPPSSAWRARAAISDQVPPPRPRSGAAPTRSSSAESTGADPSADPASAAGHALRRGRMMATMGDHAFPPTPEPACRRSSAGRPGSRRPRPRGRLWQPGVPHDVRRRRGRAAGPRDDARPAAGGVRAARRGPRGWPAARPLGRAPRRDVAPDGRSPRDPETGDVYGVAFHLRARSDLPILTPGLTEPPTRAAGPSTAARFATRGGSGGPRRRRGASGPRAARRGRRRGARPRRAAPASAPSSARRRPIAARQAPGRRRRGRAGRGPRRRAAVLRRAGRSGAEPGHARPASRSVEPAGLARLLVAGLAAVGFGLRRGRAADAGDGFRPSDSACRRRRIGGPSLGPRSSPTGFAAASAPAGRRRRAVLDPIRQGRGRRRARPRARDRLLGGVRLGNGPRTRAIPKSSVCSASTIDPRARTAARS